MPLEDNGTRRDGSPDGSFRDGTGPAHGFGTLSSSSFFNLSLCLDASPHSRAKHWATPIASVAGPLHECNAVAGSGRNSRVRRSHSAERTTRKGRAITRRRRRRRHLFARQVISGAAGGGSTFRRSGSPMPPFVLIPSCAVGAAPECRRGAHYLFCFPKRKSSVSPLTALILLPSICLATNAAISNVSSLQSTVTNQLQVC